MTANTHAYNCAMVEYYAELAAKFADIARYGTIGAARHPSGKAISTIREEFAVKNQRTAAHFAWIAREYRYKITGQSLPTRLEVYDGHDFGPY